VTADKTDLKGLSKEELYAFVQKQGLPKYRAAQLLHWIYEKNAGDIEDITEFSIDLRKSLARSSYISNLSISNIQKSSDGTGKYLFTLRDGESIESVLIPEGRRKTLCVSSQIGCAMGCLFCESGNCGLVRNLKSSEIVDQVAAVNRSISPERVSNVVFMGMGEPLANFDQVVDAIKKMTDLLGISRRRITLSTSGIVPKMRLLPKSAPEINLAVSLNATTDELRGKIMPMTKKYPLKSLIGACREYPLARGRRITFEYVLIAGLNDSPEDARRLAILLKGIPSKLNLIPLNPGGRSSFDRPSDETILLFQKILSRNGLRAFIRQSRGSDILAACGQLRSLDRNVKERS
jgi:23S rRNA (adenine2503-C2)-methyltransferase